MKKYGLIFTVLSSIVFLIYCAPTMKDLPKLQAKLSDPDEKTRISTVKKIGEIKDPTPETIPILFTTLKNDTSPAVRAECATSLKKLGFPEAEGALTEALKTDPDPTVRTNSAEALYVVAGYKVLDLLIYTSNNDSSPQVRSACLKQVGKIGGPKASQNLMGKLGDDQSSEVRAQAASSLGEMKDDGAYGLLKGTAFNDSDLDVRRACVIAVGNYPGDDSMQFLCKSLKTTDLQDAAITTIHENRRGNESREAITYILQIANNSTQIDDRVVEIFLDTQDPRVNQYLYRVIVYEYTSSDTIKAIVNKTRRENDTSMVPNLISTLRSTNNSSVQINCSRALGYFQDPRAVSVLISKLRNRGQYSSHVPGHFVWALSAIGHPNAYNYLCQMCCNEDKKRLRNDACEASSDLWRGSWRYKVNLEECPCWNK